MLSRKLIASLGVDLCEHANHSILPKTQRQRKLKIHDAFEVQSSDDSVSVDSCTSYDSDSSLSRSSHSTHTCEDDVVGAIEQWSQGYDVAKEGQTSDHVNHLQSEMDELKKKVYQPTFLDSLHKKDDERRMEEIQRQLNSLGTQPRASKKPFTNIDHNECSHCGIVGMVHINVHRCIKHCMACHRETPVEHFFETTGTNLMTTNPGRYTRRGHFISTLKRIQAKRPVKLPPTLLGEVKQYYQTHFQAKAPKDIEWKSMKPVLKALGYNNKKEKGDYTEHIMAIYCQLTGRKPPRWTILEEQTLIRDFDDLDMVFEQACYDLGEERNNWLSYELTIYRLCIKNGYDNMKEWLGILKGPGTRRRQENIMKRMFELRGWPFKPLNFDEAEQQDSGLGKNAPTGFYVKATTNGQPTILDMFTFLEQNKDAIQKTPSTMCITDHIMSTDEEDMSCNNKHKKRKLRKRKKTITRKKKKRQP